MTRRFIGVRWWLGAAFALVAAVSTAIVVSQFSSRSENAFRVHAEQLALQSATLAAGEVTAAERTGAIERRLPSIAQHFDLDLYVYDAGGHLLAKAPARTRFAPAPAEQADAVALRELGQRRAFMTSSGGIVVVGAPLRTPAGYAVVALSRRPDVAAAVGILNDQALQAGVIAGLIGVLVGLLLAQLIALRLRRLTSAAEAIAAGDFERSVALPVPRRVRRARAELRPHAAAASPLVPPHRGRARPAAHAARATARGRRHGRRPARRAVREHGGAARARHAAGRGRPAARAVVDVLAARIRVEPVRCRVGARAGARAARRGACARTRRHPGAARGRHGDDRARRLDRAGAARACGAGVRLERGARAAHAADDDHRRGRGAAGGRKGESCRARPVSHAHRTRSRAARAARACTADARACARGAGAAAGRAGFARRPPAGSGGRDAHVRRRARPGRLPARARRDREPRPARTGTAESHRQRGQAHAERQDRPARIR